MARALALFAAVALSACAPLGQAVGLHSYANPVLDADFPDPTVIRATDGYYYAYATQTPVAGGGWRNLQVARSADLVGWQLIGDALPVKPNWAVKTQDFWAPHVSQAGGRYYLYYSAKPDAALSDDKLGLCLGVATAESPQGPFADSGKPLQCGHGFVNIDPMAFDDPVSGKHLLYFGSGFEPIKVRELGPDRVSFAPGSAATELVATIKSSDPNEYQKLVEGAWVVRHGGYYYLFYSGDNCCGPNAHYAVMVARSGSPTGPFETKPGPLKVMLEADSKWVAPGHNSIVTDAAGNDWIVYHAVDRARPRTLATDDVNTRRVMLIDRIEWVDGWPVVAGGAASTGPRPAPIVSR